jgi:2,4-dienoyl-CoA reductase-like NADH-dependent reductase (Old Yellow Enzyme family)
MSNAFPTLFSPLAIRNLPLRNRIVSTGHDTCMTEGGLVTDRMIAYHRARAAGGVGLIVLQVASVHETACYTSQILRAHDEACEPGLRKLADALHAEGAAVFGQLLHPGREIHGSDDGTATVTWSASDLPNERFLSRPRALDKPMIDEIVQGFADTADRMVRAGLDGVEVVACYHYLASQFLGAATNQRDDAYGGSFENRMRFLREVLAAIRARIGPDPAVGIRISAGDLDGIGLTQDEALDCCVALEADGLVDFVSLALGSSASHGGAYHIVAPMNEDEGYSAPFGAPFKARLKVPVILTGRIVQPQTAEKIIADGQADACGMTRALICDPDLPRKAQEQRSEDIRACIGCNQACIGHFFLGVPISCIQNPSSGREYLGARAAAARPSRVLVVGGGPAGMKAAVEAAQAGHHVTLAESGPRLGGQALLAQLLPDRAEFGGLITNLEHDLRRAQVRVCLNTEITRDHPLVAQSDHVIMATGATPSLPQMEGRPGLRDRNDADILNGTIRAGKTWS